jgi:hypothetical protein
MRLLERIRLRFLWVLVGVFATTIGVISLTTLPAWPIVGVAVATLAFAVNSVAARLKHDTCAHCGSSIKGQPLGEHGVICSHCGQISHPAASTLALGQGERRDGNA